MNHLSCLYFKGSSEKIQFANFFIGDNGVAVEQMICPQNGFRYMLLLSTDKVWELYGVKRGGKRVLIFATPFPTTFVTFTQP
jgi:hypothetical protein